MRRLVICAAELGFKMPCYYPRTVWRSWAKSHPETRKPVTLFKKPHLFYSSPRHIDFYKPEEFQIPGCKPKCIGCIEDRSRSWSVRCWHESLLFDSNCFITLTFNEKYCPKSLDHEFIKLFLKRFRKFVHETVGAKLRFFMCGEYGSLNLRPHYHFCIFGYDFPDRVLLTTRNGVNLYTSEMLSRLWSVPLRGSLRFFSKFAIRGESLGYSTIGDVTPESAAYVARYVVKKFESNHPVGSKPEYGRMSNRPGIGKKFIENFTSSVFPEGAVVMPKGGKCKPPRYYDNYFELTHSELFVKMKGHRKLLASLSTDNSPERLRAREKVKQAQFKQLKRSIK